MDGRTSLRSKLIRLAHQRPDLRPHLLPLLAKRALDDFDGFDGFGNEDIPAVNDAYEAVLSITKALGGGLNQTVPLSTYVKPSGTSGLENHASLWRNKGWAIFTKAKNKAEAFRIGSRVQANLVAPSNLTSSDPYVHTLPLFVIYEGGEWVKLDPLEKKKKEPKGPSVSELKAEIVQKVEDLFGPKSARIVGSEGRYKIQISPTEPKAKKLFSPTSASAETLEALTAKVDAAIAKAKEHLK